MRTDIYVVQKTAEEGKELEQWCLKNDLPIDCTRFSFIPDWNKFAWHHNGFVKNLKTETSTAVTIEEFKRLQLESLGKTETSQELIMLPDEGCFYGTKEQQTAFARFLYTRPFCRADGKITKDETIGIGWNKTSHWWLKTKTSI